GDRSSAGCLCLRNRDGDHGLALRPLAALPLEIDVEALLPGLHVRLFEASEPPTHCGLARGRALVQGDGVGRAAAHEREASKRYRQSRGHVATPFCVRAVHRVPCGYAPVLFGSVRTKVRAVGMSSAASLRSRVSKAGTGLPRKFPSPWLHSARRIARRYNEPFGGEPPQRVVEMAAAHLAAQPLPGLLREGVPVVRDAIAEQDEYEVAAKPPLRSAASVVPRRRSGRLPTGARSIIVWHLSGPPTFSPNT